MAAEAPQAPRGGLSGALMADIARRGAETRAAIHNAAQVRPTVWLGSSSTATDATWLKTAGITRVLAVGLGMRAEAPDGWTIVETGEDDEPDGVEGAGPSSASDASSRVIRRLELPVADVDGQDVLHLLPRAFSFIDGAAAEGGAVLVHCNAGVSRSASVCIALVMRDTKCTYDEALAAVRRARSVVAPIRGFERQLRQLEDTFRTDGSEPSEAPPTSPAE